MKKIVLTIAALAVAAAMVFSFAGCTDETTSEPDSAANSVVEDNSGADTLVETPSEGDTAAA